VGHIVAAITLPSAINWPPGSAAHLNFLAPEMIVNCVPRANVDLEELVDSGHRAMALYNKMIGRAAT
jgi:hypothetical protein